MANFNKFNQFVQDIATGVHNLNTATLKVMFTDVSPVATNKVKADITEIAAGNGYVAGGIQANFVSGGDVAGLYRLILAQPSVTAASGSIAQFRYVVLYNASLASGNLIGWYDFGSELNITNGNTFLVALDQTNGVLTLT
jgi:hypothetical protein